MNKNKQNVNGDNRDNRCQYQNIVCNAKPKCVIIPHVPIAIHVKIKMVKMMVNGVSVLLRFCSGPTNCGSYTKATPVSGVYGKLGNI